MPEDDQKPLSEAQEPEGRVTEAESEGVDEQGPGEEGEDEAHLKKKKPSDSDDDEPPPPYSKNDPQEEKEDDNSPNAAPSSSSVGDGESGAPEATNHHQPKLDSDQNVPAGSQTEPENTPSIQPEPALMNLESRPTEGRQDETANQTSSIPSPASMSRISSPEKGRTLSDLTRITPEDELRLSQQLNSQAVPRTPEIHVQAKESIGEGAHDSPGSSDNTLVNSQSQPSQSELGVESASSTMTSGSYTNDNHTSVYVSSPTSDKGQMSSPNSKMNEGKRTDRKLKEKVTKRMKGRRFPTKSVLHGNKLQQNSVPSAGTVPQETLSVSYPVASTQSVFVSSQESSCFEGLSPEFSDFGEHSTELDIKPREIVIRKNGSSFGMSLAFDDKNRCIVVKSVSSSGAVGRDGRIRVGDRIDAINGKTLLSVNLSKAKSILKRVSQKSEELIITYAPVAQVQGYPLPSGGTPYTNIPGTRSSVTEGGMVVPQSQQSSYFSPVQSSLGAQSNLPMHPVIPAPSGHPFSHTMIPGMSPNQQWHVEGASPYHAPVPQGINVQGGYFGQFDEQMSKPPPPYMYPPYRAGPNPTPGMLSQGPHPQHMAPYQAPPPPTQSWSMNQTSSNVHLMQHSANLAGSQWAGIPGGHLPSGPVHREPPQYNDLHMRSLQASQQSQQPQTQQQAAFGVGGQAGLTPGQQQYMLQPPQGSHFGVMFVLWPGSLFC